MADAAANSWYEGAGRYADRFEQEFSSYVGRQFAICLPSCTSALHLSLLALGIGPGDEVIVPDVTWIASVAPVTYVGATPVFADIDPSTWCLSPASFASNITARTRAVIPVDLYGSLPDMDPILDTASQHGIAVIEDAAEAIGSKYKGRRSGSFGHTSTFSFHGSKTLTTGEGGIVVTDDEALYRRMLVLRDHGRSPGDISFFNGEVAFKYKMSELQAAFGLAQLERIDELVQRKRDIFAWYRARLQDHGGLTLNPAPVDTELVHWMVTALVNGSRGASKEVLGKEFAARGIDTRPFFHPLSSLPAYRDLPGASRARSTNEVSYRLSPTGINLPSALRLTEADVEVVVRALVSILRTDGG